MSVTKQEKTINIIFLKGTSSASFTASCLLHFTQNLICSVCYSLKLSTPAQFFVISKVERWEWEKAGSDDGVWGRSCSQVWGSRQNRRDGSTGRQLASLSLSSWNLFVLGDRLRARSFKAALTRTCPKHILTAASRRRELDTWTHVAVQGHT